MRSATSPGPHNVWIANLNNDGGVILPCPVPRCIRGFRQPVGLRIHTCSGKHTFTPASQSQQKSAHLLQRFWPQLLVNTPVKSPHTEKVSNLHSNSPLFTSDSDSLGNKSIKPHDNPSEHNTTPGPTPPSIQPDALLHDNVTPVCCNSTPWSPATPTSSSNKSGSTCSHMSMPSPSSASTSTSSSSSMSSDHSDHKMDVDAPQTLDGVENSDSESIGCSRLHEDVDDDGIPFAWTYHPILDCEFLLFPP